tara:strand:+ start:89 stop:442 length:354 start_codon:yes stop_codon:yes gene_type:complete
MVIREWGHYIVLHEGDGFTVKELVISPHNKLSMQRHRHRSETWNIVKGKAHIITNHKMIGDPFDGAYIHHLHKENPFTIPALTWHSGRNDSDKPAHIIEIWKGNSKDLSEDDIERWD